MLHTILTEFLGDTCLREKGRLLSCTNTGSIYIAEVEATDSTIYLLGLYLHTKGYKYLGRVGNKLYIA